MATGLGGSSSSSPPLWRASVEPVHQGVADAGPDQCDFVQHVGRKRHQRALPRRHLDRRAIVGEQPQAAAVEAAGGVFLTRAAQEDDEGDAAQRRARPRRVGGVVPMRLIEAAGRVSQQARSFPRGQRDAEETADLFPPGIELFFDPPSVASSTSIDAARRTSSSRTMASVFSSPSSSDGSLLPASIAARICAHARRSRQPCLTNTGRLTMTGRSSSFRPAQRGMNRRRRLTRDDAQSPAVPTSSSPSSGGSGTGATWYGNNNAVLSMTMESLRPSRASTVLQSVVSDSKPTLPSTNATGTAPEIKLEKPLPPSIGHAASVMSPGFVQGIELPIASANKIVFDTPSVTSITLGPGPPGNIVATPTPPA